MTEILKRLELGSGFNHWVGSCWRFNFLRSAEISESVATTIAMIKATGNDALIELTAKFDNWQPNTIDDLQIEQAEIASAAHKLTDEQRQALESAAKRISEHHLRQVIKDDKYVDSDGNQFTRRHFPLARVGIYVPGGSANYPSSLLMGALPARASGVKQLDLITPALPSKLSPWVAAAAEIVGITGGWRLGGAQAIAAVALGTKSIIAVDKIVGPGNAYVAEAKRQLVGKVGIDLLAGPSELLIIGDGSAPAAWLAAELLAQAEHDVDAKVAMISTDDAEIEKVKAEVVKQLEDLPRAEQARQALAVGALIKVKDLATAHEIGCQLAPEHLLLAVGDDEQYATEQWICGTLCIGAQSSVTFTDYCAGTNHVLPTSGTARFSSGLSVADFIRTTNQFEAATAAIEQLADTAAIIARGEGLDGHANAALIRKKPTED